LANHGESIQTYSLTEFTFRQRVVVANSTGGPPPSRGVRASLRAIPPEIYAYV